MQQLDVKAVQTCSCLACSWWQKFLVNVLYKRFLASFVREPSRAAAGLENFADMFMSVAQVLGGRSCQWTFCARGFCQAFRRAFARSSLIRKHCTHVHVFGVSSVSRMDPWAGPCHTSGRFSIKLKARC